MDNNFKQLLYRQLEIVELVAENNPDNHNILLLKGAIEELLDKKETALESYNRVIGDLKDEYRAYLQRARLHFNRRDLNNALKDIKTAAALNPDDSEVFYLEGEIYRKMKLWEVAVNSYSKAVNLDGNHIEALYSRGYILRDLGVREESVKDLERARRLEKANREERPDHKIYGSDIIEVLERATEG